MVEKEGVPGGKDAAVDADGAAALRRGERDLGVGAVEEGHTTDGRWQIARATFRSDGRGCLAVGLKTVARGRIGETATEKIVPLTTVFLVVDR